MIGAYDRFEWDGGNLPKTARHGVQPAEAEQVLRGDPLLQISRRGYRQAWGQNAAGRYLLVVYLRKPGGVIRVITARDMTEREKHRLRRRWR